MAHAQSQINMGFYNGKISIEGELRQVITDFEIENNKIIGEYTYENNKGKWISRILSYLKIKKNKNEELRLLALFLNKLSTQKPDFIIELLERNTNELKPYLTDILDGLLNSQQRKKAILQINTWINDGKYLIECAKLDLNISLINQIFDKL
jgi:hypothetical protein